MMYGPNHPKLSIVHFHVHHLFIFNISLFIFVDQVLLYENKKLFSYFYLFIYLTLLFLNDTWL